MNTLKHSTYQVGLFAFLVLGSGVLYGSWKVQQTKNASADKEIELVAGQASLRIGQFLNSHVFAVEMLARAVEEGDIEGQEEFEAYALRLQDSFVGFQAVNWVDTEGVIQWVTPLQTNEAAVQRNVFSGELSGRALEDARESLSPRMTAPLTLFQGGTGVAVYCPVAPAGEGILGYVDAVFTTENVVREVFGPDALGEFNLSITDQGEVVFGSPTAVSADFNSTMTTVPILNREWNVYLERQETLWAGSGQIFDPTLLLFGGGLALALSTALHYLFKAQAGRRRAAEERSELESQLLHAQKMEAVGRLAGGVAHDFNNLLTTILGNADLIDNVGQLSPGASASLDQIRIAGERATQLTGKLLTISRKQVVQPRQIDFNSEIRELDGVLRRLIRENIEFDEQIDRSMSVVELDPALLSQVIINLVVNAVDAMPQGGTLRVLTENLHSERDGTSGAWVVLTVEDTGIGMDEDTRRRALEPFFTTKGKGTGLGLATVEGIASSAGGSVEIQSNTPSGTRVSVWFPLSDKPLDEEVTPPDAPFTGGGRAMIVEDEPAVRNLGARLLRDSGYEVVEARNGVEALQLAESEGEFDLIFTDAVMPKLGGRSLLEQLHERGLQFDAVITSGYPDELSAADIERLGAEFLAKPYTAQTLRKAIHNASDLGAPAQA